MTPQEDAKSVWEHTSRAAHVGDGRRARHQTRTTPRGRSVNDSTESRPPTPASRRPELDLRAFGDLDGFRGDSSTGPSFSLSTRASCSMLAAVMSFLSPPSSSTRGSCRGMSLPDDRYASVVSFVTGLASASDGRHARRAQRVGGRAGARGPHTRGVVVRHLRLDPVGQPVARRGGGGPPARAARVLRVPRGGRGVTQVLAFRAPGTS